MMQREIKWILLFGLLVISLGLPFNQIVSAQDGIAEVGVFEPAQVANGGTVQVPVSVRNVQELYGFDLTLEFDPAVVQVVDMDSAQEGIQVGQGQFLDPGLLLFSTADNETGTIRFTMSQYNPSEPKNGSGILVVVTFQGIAVGDSKIEVSELLLSTREGVEIPSRGVSSSIVVSTTAPAQEATYPVVEPTGMIIIHTFTPEPTPTKTPSPVTVPLETIAPDSAVLQAEPTTGQTNSTGESETRSPYFLLNNWWIVLILLLVVIAVGINLLLKHRNQKEDVS